MKKLRLKTLWFIAAGFVIAFYSCKNDVKTETKSQTSGIDITEVRKTIESIDRQFALDFKNGDSLALAAHYASDGSIGSVKGKDNLINVWGQMIRSAVKEGNPIVEYTTNSLSTDGEFLAELGVYKFKDTNGNVKSQGKYLVVWKMEDGKWKLYKDMGL